MLQSIFPSSPTCKAHCILLPSGHPHNKMSLKFCAEVIISFPSTSLFLLHKEFICPQQTEWVHSTSFSGPRLDPTSTFDPHFLHTSTNKFIGIIPSTLAGPQFQCYLHSEDFFIGSICHLPHLTLCLLNLLHSSEHYTTCLSFISCNISWLTCLLICLLSLKLY